MKIKFSYLIIGAHLVFTPGVLRAEESPKAYPTTCQPGIWELDSLDVQRDGNYINNKASGTRYCLFDGGVKMEEFRYLSDSDEVTFRGVSFHIQNEAHTEETVFWAMVGDMGISLVKGEIKEGELKTQAQGFDNSGEFISRATISYPTSSTYLFLMDRSYDGGEKWIVPFNRIDGKKVTETPPPLPAEFSGSPLEIRPWARGNGVWHHTIRHQMPDGRGWLGYAEEKVQIILDGYAEMSEITEFNRDGTLHARYIKVATLGPNNQGWRTVTWRIDTNEIITENFAADTLAGQRVMRGQEDAVAEVRFEEASETYFIKKGTFGEASETVIGHKITGVGDQYNVAPATFENQGCNDYKFTLGHWQLSTSSMKADRSQNPGVGYVYGYRIHDGSTLAAEMHVIFEDGTGFRGTTFRTLDPQSGTWHITWVQDGGATQPSGVSDANNPDICEEVWDQEDQYGPFQTKLRLIDLTPTSFDVIMDRQYLGEGAPLIPNLWSYSATRVVPEK